MDTAWLVSIHYLGDETTTHRLTSNLNLIAFLIEVAEWHDVTHFEVVREGEEQRRQ